MKTDVTKQQVEQYQQQGYIVIDGFLDAQELEHWRKVTEEAIRLRLNDTTILSNQTNPETFYAQVFTQCLRLADVHPGMAELMFNENLGKLVGTLSGADGIRIWHDQALVK